MPVSDELHFLTDTNHFKEQQVLLLADAMPREGMHYMHATKGRRDVSVTNKDEQWLKLEKIKNTIKAKFF